MYITRVVLVDSALTLVQSPMLFSVKSRPCNSWNENKHNRQIDRDSITKLTLRSDCTIRSGNNLPHMQFVQNPTLPLRQVCRVGDESLPLGRTVFPSFTSSHIKTQHLRLESIDQKFDHEKHWILETRDHEHHAFCGIRAHLPCR